MRHQVEVCEFFADVRAQWHLPNPRVLTPGVRVVFTHLPLSPSRYHDPDPPVPDGWAA